MNVKTIKKLRTLLIEMAFGDVFRCLRIEDSQRANFSPQSTLPTDAAIISALMTTCAIVELIGRLRSGKYHDQAFSNFCLSLIRDGQKDDRYSGKVVDNLYSVVRCGLAHSLGAAAMSESKRTIFNLQQTHPNRHLKKTQNPEPIDLRGQVSNRSAQPNIALVNLVTAVEFPDRLTFGKCTIQGETKSYPPVEAQYSLHIQSFVYHCYQGALFFIDKELPNKANKEIRSTADKTLKSLGILSVTYTP